MRTANARRGHLSSRPFCTTVLMLSLFAAYSFLRHARHDGASLLKRKDEPPECRQVHTAADQCVFVKEHCADDNAGLVPYLRLYYCTVGGAQPVAFVVLVAWLGLLFTTIGIAASDFFSVNLGTIATILGLSESLAGVTFLALGNGSPDVFSTFAAMGSNSASMAVGELIGAASFIAGVVAGSMALVREFRVDRKTYARDICFFIAAVVFTMAFLADGQLQFWECCTMIGYYLIYVFCVVGWHWYTTRRKQRLRREGEARSHFYGLVGHAGDELAGEPYRDDLDDVDNGPGRPLPSSSSESAVAAPENGPIIEVDGHIVELGRHNDSDDADEDHERMVAAEVSHSMRVLRPNVQGKRRNTMIPIRPSLVGALEFRSALAHLQRESHLQLLAIPARSYSENHLNGRDRRGTIGAIPGSSRLDEQASSASHQGVNRTERAMSSGNVPVSSSMPSELLRTKRHRVDSHLSLAQEHVIEQRTPSLTSSYIIDGNLAPPPVGQLGDSNEALGHELRGETLSSRLQLQIPSRRSSYSDRSPPNSPFPRYTESPAMLTPNSQSEQADYMLPPPVPARCNGPLDVRRNSEEQSRPKRWWPHSVLPPPHVLLATMFPTLQGWREKTHWDKFISAISVPSIFLLVITLPVVESETSEEPSLDKANADHSSHRAVGHAAPPIAVQTGQIEPEDEWERYRRHPMSRRSSIRSIANGLPPPLLILENEDAVVVPNANGTSGAPKPMSATQSISYATEERPQWNRWLVCLQLFTGPLFAVFVLWANMAEGLENPARLLVWMLLYTLLGSLVLLGALLLFTTDQQRPKYHFLFCFLGFIISIAWISTVAGEVVGVLKTFGVVLGISEALLGLTIFAAGNSVGDLVADITLARLGYPVMALSACFGGPMLNILLGIGIGGVLMMVKEANRHQHKHPDKEYKYMPYRVQIGRTLMISTVTLLVMLVVLLIAVPMNKWIVSRRIGWGLIVLWLASTVANVVVEVTGASGGIS